MLFSCFEESGQELEEAAEFEEAEEAEEAAELEEAAPPMDLDPDAAELLDGLIEIKEQLEVEEVEVIDVSPPPKRRQRAGAVVSDPYM